jgi:hypothetical protein
MTRIPDELTALYRRATDCSWCFEQNGVENKQLSRSFVDVAQPRFIGEGYWASQKKVLVLLINPGSGAGRRDSADDTHRDLIQLFGRGQGSIEAVFDHQRSDIDNWGRFTSFYCAGIGLSVDTLALANVAWCGTVGDQYPSWMLTECFSRHGADLVQFLHPSIVLISGSSIRRFRKAVQAIAPQARLILTPHYAHREGKVFEENETQRIRAELAASD